MNQRSTEQVTICEPDGDDPIHSDNKFTPATNSAKTFKCYCAIDKPTGQIYTEHNIYFISL